jgi:hypothetical protein
MEFYNKWLDAATSPLGLVPRADVMTRELYLLRRRDS